MNANLKKAIGLALVCLVLAGCEEAKKEAVMAAAKIIDKPDTAQYGPECNWLNKQHKFITPGGCTKKQMADWHAAQP